VVLSCLTTIRVARRVPRGQPTPADAEWVENLNVKPDKDFSERFSSVPGGVAPHGVFRGAVAAFYDPYEDCRMRDEEIAYGETAIPGTAFGGGFALVQLRQEAYPAPREPCGETQAITDPINHATPDTCKRSSSRHYPARGIATPRAAWRRKAGSTHEGWSPRGTEWFPDVIRTSCKRGVDALAEAYKDVAGRTLTEPPRLTKGKKQPFLEQVREVSQQESRVAPTCSAGPPGDNPDPESARTSSGREIQCHFYERQRSQRQHTYILPLKYTNLLTTRRAFVEQDTKKTVRVHTLFLLLTRPQCALAPSTGSDVFFFFLALRCTQDQDRTGACPLLSTAGP